MKIMAVNSNHQNIKFKGVTPLVCENKNEFRKFTSNLKKLLGNEFKDTFVTRDFTDYYKRMSMHSNDTLSKLAGAGKGKRVYIIFSGIHARHADFITTPSMSQDSRHVLASQEGELGFVARLIAPEKEFEKLG